MCIVCSVSRCTAAAPNQCSTTVPITNDGTQSFKVVVNDYIYAGNNGYGLPSDTKQTCMQVHNAGWPANCVINDRSRSRSFDPISDELHFHVDPRADWRQPDRRLDPSACAD